MHRQEMKRLIEDINTLKREYLEIMSLLTLKGWHPSLVLQEKKLCLLT